MRSRNLLWILALACLPLSAHAESKTVWSFLGGNIGPEWRITGKARSAAEMGGLRIQPETDAQVFREAWFSHRVDSVEITYLTLEETQATLLWHRPDDAAEKIIQLPFTLPATTVASTVKLDTRWYDEWPSHPDMVGLALPQGADVQLVQIAFRGRNPLEKLLSLLRSYWTFDRFSPYSINFLWGPVLTPSPLAREKLFSDLPPHGTYGNTVWYLLLLAAGVGCGVWGWKTGNRRRALLCMAGMFGILWIVSDVRMGAEALSYVRTDLTGYWMQPAEKRRFRERSDFPVFLAAVRPLLRDRGRYVFLTQYEYPLLGLMRYHTYPSVPVSPEKVVEGVDTWVIYERPEIGVDSEGRLTSEGAPVSLPGEILFELRPGVFLFRTR